ncbi:MAG TPA: class I SAM-dependent methyltransferase [Myxococcaceae bacterium]|nr:class I SAM-dependent methyltransferase [Myxococcaceae bacterium]
MTAAAHPRISYDTVPYPTFAQRQTHPDRLAVQATLLGMTPAPVERCRVLEIACGDGSNLVPMAFHLPGSEFVGVDRAGAPIERARGMATDLGLGNIRFLRCDIAELPIELGSFDYVIAHGVYSWVSPQVQDALLAASCRHLSESGVAYVSYNTYPGNHLRQMVREMMLFHLRGVDDPARLLEQGIALARFVAESQSKPDSYGQLLRTELERFLSVDGNYLLHDTLEEHNLPLYFHEFAERAARHGLQYLAEADFHEMLDWGFQPEVSRTLKQLGGDRIAREQYLDFLKCRCFRQTLLCHQGKRLDLSLRPELARRFLVAAPSRPETAQVDLGQRTPERFVHPQGASLRTDWPVAKAAFLLLGERWPRALPFDEVLRLALAGVPEEAAGLPEPDAARELGAMLLRAYASGLIDLHLHAPPAIAPGENPVASALTRWELRSGRRRVTGLYHSTMSVEDEPTARLLAWADGSRTRAALREVLAESLSDPGEIRMAEEAPAASLEEARSFLVRSFDRTVDRLVRMGLLVA